MSNDLERYLIQKATAIGSPIKVTLELTPFCNLDCKMCYIHHSQDEIQAEGGLKPISYWKSMIPEMKKMGILFVALIGGEPFLYPDLQSLYEELYKNGFYTNVTTNATVLSNGIPNWLQKNPPRYVTVSLYGANDKTYELLTGNKKGFSQAISGLEKLLRAGIPVKLNYIVVRENKDDLDLIYQLKDKYHLPILATSYCFPQVRRNRRNAYIRLSPTESAIEELQIMKLDKPDKYPAQIRYLAEENFKENTAMHTDHIYCHAGKSTFWITWQGDMVPCGMMNKIHIKCRPGYLEKNWELLKKVTAESHTSLKCSQCSKREVCQACPAIMEAETGSLNGCPEYVCQITDEMIRLSREMRIEDEI